MTWLEFDQSSYNIVNNRMLRSPKGAVFKSPIFTKPTMPVFNQLAVVAVSCHGCTSISQERVEAECQAEFIPMQR